MPRQSESYKSNHIIGIIIEYANRYFEEVQSIAKSIDLNTIEKMVQIIVSVKEEKGRLFFIGVGSIVGL